MYEQYLQCAEKVYEIVEESKSTCFAPVLSYLLFYIGSSKSLNPPPATKSIASLLLLLRQLMERKTLAPFHVAMMSDFISRSKTKLVNHHDAVVDFLRTCFEEEMDQIDVDSHQQRYLITTFIRVCEYFAHVDTQLATLLADKYLVPYLNEENCVDFTVDVFSYMEIMKIKRNHAVAYDITSSLLQIISCSEELLSVVREKLCATIKWCQVVSLV